MFEQVQLTSPQEILSGVPGIAETRINALLSALKQQRDTASNAASNLAAEIEVYRQAADYYQQQSLGLQAHVAMIKNDYATLVEERSRLQEKTEMMASDLLAASGERDAAKVCVKSLVGYIESSISLKDCRQKTSIYLAAYLEPAVAIGDGSGHTLADIEKVDLVVLVGNESTGGTSYVSDVANGPLAEHF